MIFLKHICDTKECPYFGQPSPGKSCRCHKTAEQMLMDDNVQLRSALQTLIDNVESGSYESTGMAADQAKALLAGPASSEVA